MSTTPFSGILRQPASIDCLRAAAGVYIPNHAFRDANANLYFGSVAGDDGLPWYRTKFRDWYYSGTDAGDPYGNYSGARSAKGFLDAASIYVATTSQDTGETIETNHRALGTTIHTGFLPFHRYYRAHYDKALTLALVGQVPADCTLGTHIKAYVACYDSDGDFITTGSHNGLTEHNPCELVFADAGQPGTGDWERYLAHTAHVLPDNTVYIMLHIAMSSPDGNNTAFIFGDCSLMLNPASNAIATSGADLFQDLDPVEMMIGSAMAWEALAAESRTMLDGRRIRTNPIKDNLKARFSGVFRKISDDAYQELITLWNLSARGLGHYVPEPVPLCIDFGLGQLPFFGYFNITGASFNGTFNPAWQLVGQGYDVGIQFEEA